MRTTKTRWGAGLLTLIVMALLTGARADAPAIPGGGGAGIESGGRRPASASAGGAVVRAPVAEPAMGVVLTEDGTPAAGAMVTAELDDGRTVTVYTRRDGSYRFPRLPAPVDRVRARLVGRGTGRPGAGEAEIRLGGTDTEPPPGSAWLAQLPESETTRRFILDCTGCHVTDGSRVELDGSRRDSAAWHGAVDLMLRNFGPGTGFPIISSWPRPAPLAGWLQEHLPAAPPATPSLAAGDPRAVLTEYPVPVPQDLPHDLMVDPDGQVLVTGMFTHQMYTLNPEPGEWGTLPIPVPGANPRALDLDARGRWWVLLGGPGKVAIHDPTSGEWSIHDVGLYGHSIAVGPDGRGWTNGHFTFEPELLAAVDAESGSVEQFVVPSAPPGDADPESTIPYGLRVGPDGAVWGTQLRGNRLLRLDPGTGEVEQWMLPVSHSGPRRPDVGPDGSVWIPLYSANALARFDPATERFRLWPFPVPGALPYVARVHQENGRVWLGTGHGDVVAAFDPDTEQFTLYPLPTRGALLRHLDVDEARDEVWFAYGASPGIPGRVLRLQLDATARSGSTPGL